MTPRGDLGPSAAALGTSDGRRPQDRDQRSARRDPARAGRWLVVASFGLLLFSWAMTTPPGGFPDELDHYIRALAVGRGEFYGTPNPQLANPALTTDVPHSCCVPGSASSIRWVARGVRMFRIPSALAPERLGCPIVTHQVSRCGASFISTDRRVHPSDVGTLEPVPYVLPGLATRLTSDPARALQYLRLTSAAMSLALLALAVGAMWPKEHDSPLALAGIILATSPMVLFVGASPSPSAVEVTAGLAFFAVLLRLIRAPDPAADRWWLALGASGALLATSRSLGPIWILADVATAVALVGPRRTLSVVRRGGRHAAGALGLVAAAGLSTALWELTHQPRVPFDASFFHDQLYPAVLQLERTGQEVIGRFGIVDIPLPIGGTAAWVVGLSVLGVLVFARGSLRECAVLLAQLGALVVVTILVTAGVIRQNGFDIQGRHVLALAVTVPLLMGEILRRRTRRPRSTIGVTAVVLVAVVVGAVQLAALVRAGRAYGWLAFHPPAGVWMPPGGRVLWLTVVVLGSLALPMGVALAAPRERRG